MGGPFHHNYEISSLKQIPFSQQLVEYFREKGYLHDANLWLAQSPESNSSIEDKYHALRDKEGWIYPDAIVQQLPIIAQSDPHSGQWLVRKNTVHRLMKYFLVKHQGSTMWDVIMGGCQIDLQKEVFKYAPSTSIMQQDIFS
jgi:hypothetical protein